MDILNAEKIFTPEQELLFLEHTNQSIFELVNPPIYKGCITQISLLTEDSEVEINEQSPAIDA